MNYLDYSCIVFIIPRYEKMRVVEIASNEGNQLENNTFIKIYKRP